MSSYWSNYDFTKIPFSEVESLGQRTLLYRDLFAVSWLLGRYCNYKCSYCWPYARSDKRDHRPTALVKSTIDEIKRQARQRGFNSFHFSFSGGEPTLHPGYLDILNHYSADQSDCNYQSLHMTSNLSAGIGWFKKYIVATQPVNRVSITASYHKEMTTKEPFADKLVFLQENDMQVTINMVMVPERFELLWEEALYFHNRGINVTLKPQSNPTATAIVAGYTPENLKLLRNGMPQRDYTTQRLVEQNKVSIRPKYKKLDGLFDADKNTDQDMFAGEKIPSIMQVEFKDRQGQRWFIDQAERFNAFNFNNFEGWECSAGYRSIIIREPDGSVKRSYSCNDTPLGNIDTGFNLFSKPMPCITRSCVSSADSKIPKRKAGSQQPLWPNDQTFLVKELDVSI